MDIFIMFLFVNCSLQDQIHDHDWTKCSILDIFWTNFTFIVGRYQNKMVNSAIDNFTCLMTIRKNVGEPKTYGKNLTVAPV